MTIEKLSSDEVKGLLGQEETGKSEETAMLENSLTQIEKEALTELLAVSLGGSSAVLSATFSEQLAVAAPAVSVKHKANILADAQIPFFVILSEYSGDINGMQIISISKSDVEFLARLKDVESQADNMEKQFELIQEMIGQMFVSVSKSMELVLDQEVVHTLSGIDIINKPGDFPVSNFTEAEWFAEVLFELSINSEKNIDFQLYMPLQLAKLMVGELTDSTNEDFLKETQEMEFQSNKQSSKLNKTVDTAGSPNIQSVEFSSFDETASINAEPNNLNMLLDIPLQVTVELGRTKRMVKEILSVSQGSIIELDKLAGEPVDILVNDKLIAVGEVVVIDENFGVRVTDILSAADRISKLR